MPKNAATASPIRADGTTSAKPCKKVKTDIDGASRLNVLTWNVSFDPHERTRRTRLLEELISNVAPDVVALQEVVEDVASELAEPDGVLGSQYHCFREPDMRPLKTYGTCLLVSKKRWPKVEASALHHSPLPRTEMDRSLFVADLTLSDQVHLVFGTVHLESPLGPASTAKGNAAARQAQLSFALDRMEDIATAAGCSNSLVVLAGDFNRISEAEDSWINSPWNDVWLKLRPEQSGYTYDCEENRLAHDYRSRLDKVIFRGFRAATNVGDSGASDNHDGDYKMMAESIEMIGVPPPNIVPVDPMSTPPRVELPFTASDHFGLLAKFQLG